MNNSIAGIFVGFLFVVESQNKDIRIVGQSATVHYIVLFENLFS